MAPVCSTNHGTDVGTMTDHTDHDQSCLTKREKNVEQNVEKTHHDLTGA